MKKHKKKSRNKSQRELGLRRVTPLYQLTLAQQIEIKEERRRRKEERWGKDQEGLPDRS